MSRRAGGRPESNDIARLRAQLDADGIAVTGLSDSNPTRHGLLDPRVLEAVARHTGDAARYRPDPRGAQEAREALAQRFGGDADDYWLTASTSQSYAFLFALLADPGDAVAVPAPGYPLFTPLARLSGLRAVDYRLHYAHPHGWVLDTRSLHGAVADSSVRAVVAVSPGNPTGAYAAGSVDDLVAACAASGTALIADEVFAPFALDDPPASMAGEDRAVTFTLGGLSKLLCAPQLKLAWIRLGGPAAECAPLAEALDAVADLFLPVSGPVAAALPELLTLADTAVSTTRARLQTNLSTARAAFAGTAARVRRCGGGWNVIIDAPPAAAGDDLAWRLLRDAHLAVHPGWFYDLASDGALVVSLLPQPDTFANALGRLRAALVESDG